jgi:hypothetical protein
LGLAAPDPFGGILEVVKGNWNINNEETDSNGLRSGKEMGIQCGVDGRVALSINAGNRTRRMRGAALWFI